MGLRPIVSYGVNPEPETSFPRKGQSSSARFRKPSYTPSASTSSSASTSASADVRNYYSRVYPESETSFLSKGPSSSAGFQKPSYNPSASTSSSAKVDDYSAALSRTNFSLCVENDMLKQELADAAFNLQEAIKVVDEKNRIIPAIQTNIRKQGQHGQYDGEPGESNQHTLLELMNSSEISRLREKIDRMEKQAKEERDRHAVALNDAYEMGLMAAVAREGNNRPRSSVTSMGYASVTVEQVEEMIQE